jgi:uncharacterized protein
MSVAAPSIPLPELAEREPGVPAAGRLRHASVTEAERNYAIAMHLSPFALFIAGLGTIGFLAIVAPLVLWLIRREQSVFNDDHGREVINFGISFLILNVLLLITLIGWLLLIPLWVIAVISLIRAAVAAGQGEYFRYPLTFRFLS